MAENKNAKKAADAVAKTDTTEVITHDHNKREHKVSRWTLESCMKMSRRFDSREAWQKGHPSSFKAAVARGFDTECCKHMPTKTAMAKKTAAVKAAPMAKPKKSSGRAA